MRTLEIIFKIYIGQTIWQLFVTENAVYAGPVGQEINIATAETIIL